MHVNFLAVLVAAFIPLIMGFIWYNPKVMGAAWMRETGLTEEKMKNANMAIIFLLSFVFSFMLAFSMQLLVIHQMHVGSVFQHYGQDVNNPATPVGKLYETIMTNYGSEFRTFKHGAFHGTLSAIFILLPVLATNGMFERRSWKYIWINFGYWTICFLLMGGIISAWQ